MNDHGTHYYFRIMFLFPPEISLAVVHKVAHMVTDHWRFMDHGLGLDDYTLEHINNMCSHPVDKALSTLNLRWIRRWIRKKQEKTNLSNASHPSFAGILQMALKTWSEWSMLQMKTIWVRQWLYILYHPLNYHTDVKLAYRISVGDENRRNYLV